MRKIIFLVSAIILVTACRTRKINKHNESKDSTVTASFDSSHKKTEEKQSSNEERAEYDNSEKVYFNKNATITVEPNGNKIYSGIDSAVIHNKGKSHKKQEEKKKSIDSSAVSNNQQVKIVEKEKNKTVVAKPSFKWMYIAAFAIVIIVFAAVIYFKRNVIVNKFKSLLKWQ